MPTVLRRTPLFNIHAELKASMMNIAGWEMPAKYSSVENEVHVGQDQAGVFDLSHMGRIAIVGPQSEDLIRLTQKSDLFYRTALWTPEDTPCKAEAKDVPVYKLQSERFLLIVGASNTNLALTWLTKQRNNAFLKASIREETLETSLISLQGPLATKIMASVFELHTDHLSPQQCKVVEVASRLVMIALLNQTDKDHILLMIRENETEWLWNTLVAAGAEPCGLKAWETLQKEKKDSK